MRADLIIASLEIAGERCADLTPLVFARLFAERPELRPLFRKDPQLVQGEMLARTIDTILDFLGDNTYGANMLVAEASTHAGYDISSETFIDFYRIVADTLRDVLGSDWTNETASAWRDLIDELKIRAARAHEEMHA